MFECWKCNRNFITCRLDLVCVRRCKECFVDIQRGNPYPLIALREANPNKKENTPVNILPDEATPNTEITFVSESQINEVSSVTSDLLDKQMNVCPTDFSSRSISSSGQHHSNLIECKLITNQVNKCLVAIKDKIPFSVEVMSGEGKIPRDIDLTEEITTVTKREILSAKIETETVDVEFTTANVETDTADEETDAADVETERADVETASADVETATFEVEFANIEIEFANIEIEFANIEIETAPTKVVAFSDIPESARNVVQTSSISDENSSDYEDMEQNQELGQSIFEIISSKETQGKLNEVEILSTQFEAVYFEDSDNIDSSRSENSSSPDSEYEAAKFPYFPIDEKYRSLKYCDSYLEHVPFEEIGKSLQGKEPYRCKKCSITFFSKSRHAAHKKSHKNVMHYSGIPIEIYTRNNRRYNRSKSQI